MEALVAVATSAVEEIDRELYLLIDDYQHVEAPAAHRLMQKLLDHCPANLHIVIASRTVPPLSLGRLRMQGQVSEIDFAELPFDLEETRGFFDQNLSTLKLTADEVRLIHDLTNGWPASLQPVATMLRIRPAKRANLRSLLWKSADLQSYLAEDVVAYLPPALTSFMEKLSVFRRFNAGLAEAVTENAEAADLIKRAGDENLLIYRVETDDPSPWYRFHPLFGEFLAQRLAEQAQRRRADRPSPRQPLVCCARPAGGGSAPRQPRRGSRLRCRRHGAGRHPVDLEHVLYRPSAAHARPPAAGNAVLASAPFSWAV
ncbi:hypothetical protein ACU4HD_10475 [Cupriavidus basilensis]